MKAFTRIPYSKAIERAEKQDAILSSVVTWGTVLAAGAVAAAVVRKTGLPSIKIEW
jgi:hypothetical protein